MPNTATTDDFLKAATDQEFLNNALEALRQEHSEWEQMGDAIKSRMSVIEALLGGSQTPAVTGARTSSNGSAPNELSISDEKLGQVLDYMRKNHKARQADIAQQTAFNSGTVSVALRKLKAQGAVREAGRENGSRMWEFIRVPAHA